MLKKDNFLFGFILGLVMPFLGIPVFYFWKFYPTFSFTEYIDALKDNPPLISALSISCLLINIIIFTWYVNTKRDKTVKGLFIATLLYALFALAIKLF